MTREEREKAIYALKISAPVTAVTQEEFNDYIQTLNKIMDWLEQEPCDDCVSRQAVLDLPKNTERGFGGKILEQSINIEYIKALPPVTPQYTEAEIQKMQDLEFAEIQKAYEIGKVEKSNKWIPVSERLPEEETDVLICNGNGDIEISRGSYSTEVANDFIWYTSGWLFGKVTAWMPLPEPYKQEVEE